MWRPWAGDMVPAGCTGTEKENSTDCRTNCEDDSEPTNITTSADDTLNNTDAESVVNRSLNAWHGQKQARDFSLQSATHKLPPVTWFLHPTKDPTKLVLKRRRYRRNHEAETENSVTAKIPVSIAGNAQKKRKHSCSEDKCKEEVGNGTANVECTSTETYDLSEENITPPAIEAALHQTICAVNDLVPLERKRGGLGCTSTEALCQEDALIKSGIDFQNLGNTERTGPVSEVGSETSPVRMNSTRATSTITYADIKQPGLVKNTNKPCDSVKQLALYADHPDWSKNNSSGTDKSSSIVAVSSTEKSSFCGLPVEQGMSKDRAFLGTTNAHVTSVRCTSPPLEDIALPSDAQPGIQSFHQVKQSPEVFSPTATLKAATRIIEAEKESEHIKEMRFLSPCRKNRCIQKLDFKDISPYAEMEPENDNPEHCKSVTRAPSENEWEIGLREKLLSSTPRRYIPEPPRNTLTSPSKHIPESTSRSPTPSIPMSGPARFLPPLFTLGDSEIEKEKREPPYLVVLEQLCRSFPDPEPDKEGPLGSPNHKTAPNEKERRSNLLFGPIECNEPGVIRNVKPVEVNTIGKPEPLNVNETSRGQEVHRYELHTYTESKVTAEEKGCLQIVSMNESGDGIVDKNKDSSVPYVPPKQSPETAINSSGENLSPISKTTKKRSPSPVHIVPEPQQVPPVAPPFVLSHPVDPSGRPFVPSVPPAMIGPFGPMPFMLPLTSVQGSGLPGLPLPYPMFNNPVFLPPMALPLPFVPPHPPGLPLVEVKQEMSPNTTPTKLQGQCHFEGHPRINSPSNIKQQNWSSQESSQEESSPLKVMSCFPASIFPAASGVFDAASSPPPKKRRRVFGPKVRLNAKAVRLMRESFLKDRYPNASEKERLAREGGISVQQVNSWFTNFRRKLDYQKGMEVG